MIYFFARAWKEEGLAKRIAALIYGAGASAEKREGETRWHIGRGNNWWLHPKGGDKYMLHYRYPTEEKMQALSVLLEWLLSVEITTEDN